MSQPQGPASCSVLVTMLCPPLPRSLPCQPGPQPASGNPWAAPVGWVLLCLHIQPSAPVTPAPSVRVAPGFRALRHSQPLLREPEAASLPSVQQAQEVSAAGCRKSWGRVLESETGAQLLAVSQAGKPAPASPLPTQEVLPSLRCTDETNCAHKRYSDVIAAAVTAQGQGG